MVQAITGSSPASPVVSVVIPTRGRPQLLKRAVASVQAQTLGELEMIVVVDGSCDATLRALEEIGDERLRVVALAESLGGGGARNTGVAESRGEWVAFLDDDDEWMPHKLQRQLEAAQRSRFRYPVLTSQLVARTPRGEYVWPRRQMEARETVSEYLFARSTIFQGESLMQTSTFFAPRELLLRVPFRDLRRHQDWDWLMRVSVHDGVGFESLAEPLAIWYAEESRASLSSQNQWKFSLGWAREQRELFSARSYAAFLLTVVSSIAARDRDWRAAARLLSEAVRVGRPAPIDLLLFAGMWLVPQDSRRMLRSLLFARRRMAAGGNR